MHNKYTDMNTVNWDDLRYFLAAAESGSLSAAAKRLHSNQPTVGRHIDSLEKVLGVKLFKRHTQGLSLSREGEIMLAGSELMRSGVLKMQHLFNGQTDTADGTVCVALPEGLANEMLIPTLPEFYQRYPQINLILKISSRSANLSHGEADIALRLFRPSDANLVVKRLGDMQLGLYAAADYLQQHGMPKKQQDLHRHKLIAYGDELIDLPENQWLLKHAEDAAIVLQSDSTSARIRATEAGLGLSILPDLLISGNTKLRRLFSLDELPAYEIWLVYHRDLRHIARIRAVAEYFSELFRSENES